MTRSMKSVAQNKHATQAPSTVYQDGRLGMPTETGATRSTAIAHNRAKCVGEGEMADRTSFEYRCQEIMSMRQTGNVLNARVIETWINETLSDAEHLDIPGVVLKP